MIFLSPTRRMLIITSRYRSLVIETRETSFLRRETSLGHRRQFKKALIESVAGKGTQTPYDHMCLFPSHHLSSILKDFFVFSVIVFAVER